MLDGIPLAQGHSSKGLITTHRFTHLAPLVVRSKALTRSRKEFDLHPSGARPIELTEEDSLPGPQRQAPILEWDADTRAKKAGHKMAGAIALAVAVIGLPSRGQTLEVLFDIVDHGRVGVLIDGDGGRCVGNIQDDHPILHAAAPQVLLHFGRDLDQLNILACAYLEAFHRTCSLMPVLGDGTLP